MTKDNRSHYEDWCSVAVIPAPPGMRNYWKLDAEPETSQPCYFFLLQELRLEEFSWDEPRRDGTVGRCSRTTRHEPPYSTRVVGADLSDGELRPAIEDSNFAGTDVPETTPLTESTNSDAQQAREAR